MGPRMEDVFQGINVTVPEEHTKMLLTDVWITIVGQYQWEKTPKLCQMTQRHL